MKIAWIVLLLQIWHCVTYLVLGVIDLRPFLSLRLSHMKLAILLGLGILRISIYIKADVWGYLLQQYL